MKIYKFLSPLMALVMMCFVMLGCHGDSNQSQQEKQPDPPPAGPNKDGPSPFISRDPVIPQGSGNQQEEVSTKLALLKTSAGRLDPPFNPNINNYVLVTNPLITQSSITAQTKETKAFVQLNEAEPIIHQITQEMNLTNKDLINIKVTSSTNETENYSMLVKEQPLHKTAVLTASNADMEDEFGSSIAIDGNILVVGAPYEQSSSNQINEGEDINIPRINTYSYGAAYIFVKNDQNQWEQEAYLKASNADEGDDFGRSVAVYGNTIVIGAPHEASNASGVNGDQQNNEFGYSGAVYVFVKRDDGQWVQQAYIKPHNPDAWDFFGKSVSLYENTLVVGAHGEDSSATGVNGVGNEFDVADRNPWWNGAGAAYVFHRNEQGNWSQEAYLKAFNPEPSDNFGNSTAISKNTIVIGAYGEDSSARGINNRNADNNAPASGAAYVFVKENGNWSQQAYLKASNTNNNDYFGSDVAIDNNIIVIGAPEEDSNALGINGNQNDNSLIQAGAAYVFKRNDNGHWQQMAYLKSANHVRERDELERFGVQISIRENNIAIGSFKPATTLFRIKDQTVTYLETLPGNAADGVYLPLLYNGSIIVGNPMDSMNWPNRRAQGLVYVFE